MHKNLYFCILINLKFEVGFMESRTIQQNIYNMKKIIYLLCSPLVSPISIVTKVNLYQVKHGAKLKQYF